MKAADTHKLSAEELTTEEQKLRRQLYDLRTQAVTQKLENPRLLKNIRRDIARILTEQKLRVAKESA